MRVLFVCHGNICRSPMAEFVLKELIRRAGRESEFEVASAATSAEELGNDLYPPVKRLLRQKGVPFEPRAARQVCRRDMETFDRVIVMDRFNRRNLERMFGPSPKVCLLMEYTGEPRDVADPWYTDDFETAWNDILAGCEGFLRMEKGV